MRMMLIMICLWQILDDFREQSNDNLDSNIWNQQPDESVNYEDSNIDFEAIFDEELEESD